MARLVIAMVVVAAVAGYLLFSSQRDAGPLRVSGFIEADEIRVGSRVGGRVERVLVVEGQRIAESAPLVRLEAYDLLERLAEAEATLAAKTADHEKLVAGYRIEDRARAKAERDARAATLDKLVKGPRQQEIDAAKARLNAADSQLALAKDNLDRIVQLVRRNAGTKEELDRATNEWELAQSNQLVRTKELAILVEGTRPEELSEARALLAAAAENVKLLDAGYRAEEVAAAKAAADAARAARDAVKRQLEELAIRAPGEARAASGASSTASAEPPPTSAAGAGAKPFVVEALELQAGDLVASGAPVLSLADTRNLWVRAYVPENRLNIKEDQQVRVSVDSYPSESFRGRVTFISRQAEFTPGNVQTPEERSKQVFRIKVTLEEGLDKLRPGMAADVEF
jgi:multidrug resistance efflux pump